MAALWVAGFAKNDNAGILATLALVYLSFSVVSADSKAVTTTLTTKWPSTPLLLEASEFLAEESKTKFWDFVNAAQEIHPNQETDLSYYKNILQKAGEFLTPVQANLLKFALSLRSYSATVQTFQQIAAEEPPPEDCSAFVNVHGEKSCNPDGLEVLLQSALERPKPYLFKGDHIDASLRPELPVVILYGEIGTKEFSKFHKLLRSKSDVGNINYVLRHYVANPSKEKVFLSGYGVELAIKSTEYKAKDDTQVTGSELNATVINENDPVDEVQGFLFGKLKQLYPEIKEQLKELRKHLVESTNEMAPLKVWQLQDLSFQAAARILAAPTDDALMVMRDLSQNFPTKARSITRTVVNSDMRREIEEHQQTFKETFGLHPGDSALFINGLSIDLDVQDIFSVLDLLRNEARLMEGLHDLGIQGDELHELLKLNVQPADSDYGVEIRNPAIYWINNLETDSKYNTWPSNVQELLRPTFLGVIRQIRKNFHNFVLIVDPTDEGTPELLKMAEMFYTNDIPLRIGLVFVVDDSDEASGLKDPGVALFRAFNFVADELDNMNAFQTIISIYSKVKEGEKLAIEHIIGVLEKDFSNIEVSSILGPNSAYDRNRKECKDYYKQSGLGPLPIALYNGMPYQREQLDPDELETVTMHKILDNTAFFQKVVYLGELNNDQDVVDFIMNQPSIVPRINSRILSSERDYLDLSAEAKDGVDDYSHFVFLKSEEKSAAVANNMQYLSKRDDKYIRPLTFWIVGDFDDSSGRQLLYESLKHLKSSNNLRIGLINNPTTEPTEENTIIARAIWAALNTQSLNNAKNFITKLAKEETAKALADGVDIMEFAVGGMDNDAFKKMFETLKLDFILSHNSFCKDVVKLKGGQRAVISNGRIIGPLEENEIFNQNDFHLLESIAVEAAEKIKVRIRMLMVEEDHASDLVMKVDSLLSSKSKGESRLDLRFFEGEFSAIKLRPKEEQVYFEVMAITDPVTRDAQRLSSFLLVLHQLVNMNLHVLMNCQPKLSEMPLKSIYRFVLEPEITFSADGSFGPGPVAKFLDMPQSPLFTLIINTPESWMVESVHTSYDLDNIYLKEIDGGIAAEYELEYLLLEGHCYDVSTGQPPRGLQFTLGTNANQEIVDTIVMANLGYFQLKANPGAWVLRLRKGRSEDIYKIYSHDGTDSPAGTDEVTVVLNSFKSKIIKVKVQKKPEKMSEELLSDDNSENEGFWESIKRGFTGGPKPEELRSDKEDVINIFSVASGHLYERFLRIMMLSVLKHTETPVKFWFLKNYLSPTFKEFIPHMAKKYGFQYELVQYKWPRWLHQQTEKQRIIWGYKILFLDVLFPLAVDKILFVDADQIVRADLKELRDLDLEGAPYGYTPFCESRKEMDGYRFWKSGYWANHLQGRKYHISALYVVDLKKFRKIAAGDRLRGQYQGLSQDPNSLSNLDQDLPNNMIHQVPIKSLPQHWLWCETWCDEASKKRAKTIDLCNNPMTKEPKLEAAVRIVPEWQDYDQELKQLQKLFQEGKLNGLAHTGADDITSTEGHTPHGEL
ncbi:UDP-glucose:glycoprotein glucosyltransferase 1 isoform X2 [Stegostoma tigrinum]|uniref:UDP-glucose:glycoprotein glucosyltransferase 1 isoform X2 n=1 Tax=Stegostoma tigrinum TaxID=3053191 RepID=UPI0028700D56|nr:UDP-glucose:glycoprotein glucosyltransferase 1 isoform X2 [Stegostoma tigrinum]